MRAILVTLVVFNIAYFVYQQYVHPEPVRIRVTSVKEDNVESIVLLRENLDRKLRLKEMDLVVSNPVKVDIDSNPDCIAVGPFADLFEGQDVVEQLISFELGVELKAIDNKTIDSDFRVMISPMNSLQEAFRKLRELQSQKIDSYVISQGEDTLGISLGVFSTKDAADALLAKLKKAGYNVKIVGIPMVTREFWIFSTTGKDLKLDSQVWAALVKNYPVLELRRKQCHA